ncbi:MAG: ABC transporter ATP-binding protein [Candidatus Heimdallarchaeaceae archaeon]
MLRIRNLSVKYQLEKSYALNSINIDAKAGEFIVIAGPSGSGKSTLANVLMSLIPNFIKADIDGIIEYNDESIFSLDRKKLIKLLGYVPQYPSDFTTSLLVEEEIVFVLENLAIEANEINKRLDSILDLLRIKHLKKRLITELSSGELQRVALAVAIVTEAPLIVLDEPIARIDSKSEVMLAELLRDIADKGHLVIAFEHRLDYILQKADRLIILDEGKIISDGLPKKTVNLLKNIDPPEISALECSSKEQILTIYEAVDKCGDFFTNLPKSQYKLNDQKVADEETDISVKLDSISFRYNSKTDMVLKDIDLSLYAGQSIGLMGINGCGKSTLLKIISGINKTASGGIYLNNSRVKSIRKSKNHVILVPENAKLFLIGPTPFRDLSRIIKEPRTIHSLYKETALTHLMNKKLYHLSEGERRLFAIVNAFQFSDDIIIIDEPTIGLDKQGRKVLSNLINRATSENKTVIIASNDPRIFVDLDRLIVIKDGKIGLDGDPREVLYELENKTDLIPNQIVCFIQMMEEQFQSKLPHFVNTNEVNEFLRSVR